MPSVGLCGSGIGDIYGLAMTTVNTIGIAEVTNGIVI